MPYYTHKILNTIKEDEYIMKPQKFCAYASLVPEISLTAITFYGLVNKGLIETVEFIGTCSVDYMLLTLLLQLVLMLVGTFIDLRYPSFCKTSIISALAMYTIVLIVPIVMLIFSGTDLVLAKKYIGRIGLTISGMLVFPLIHQFMASRGPSKY